MSAIQNRPTVILLVEDEALVRMIAADVLMETGEYRVLEAVNAKEALTLLESRHDVRLVFTDVEMPGPLNGFALARIVDMRFPGIRVIVTSGQTRPGAGDLPSGVPFLPKPYSSLALIGMVRHLLGEASGPGEEPANRDAAEPGVPVLPMGIKLDQLHSGIGTAGGLAQPLPEPEE